MSEVLLDKIRAKKKFARETFNKEYTPKEQRKNSILLQSIYTQIEVCEAMCCPIPEKTIKDWIVSKSMSKIRTEARSIKFAS